MQFRFHLRTVEFFKRGRERDLECVHGNGEIYFPVVVFVGCPEITNRWRT